MNMRLILAFRIKLQKVYYWHISLSSLALKTKFLTDKTSHKTDICIPFCQAMFTLYWIVKRSVAESVPDRASVHIRNAAFESVSAPEQYCSAPLLKVERPVSDRFLRRSESSLNTLSEQKLQRNLVLVNYLFKFKGSVANCITGRASVHTGNASEQFLHHNRTLISVHTVPKQLLKRSKNLSGTV